MIRKTGIRIRVQSLPYGAFVAFPESVKWNRAFAGHMLKYTGHYDSSAFFQGEWELPETITQNRQYGELRKGWDICILVDPWEFGHWLGYDAHIVAEGRM